MGIVTVIAGPELTERLYDEGAALPHRGMSILSDMDWGGGLRYLTIITDQTPTGYAGRGVYNAVIENGGIRFKRDCDV